MTVCVLCLGALLGGRPAHADDGHHQYPAPTRAAVFRALETAGSVQLFSIDPGELHQRICLGSTRIAGREKAILVHAFERGVNEANAVGMCFEPRHAIMVQTPKATYRLLICYQCSKVYASQVDPKQPFSPNEDRPELQLLTTETPAAVLNKLLKASTSKVVVVGPGHAARRGPGSLQVEALGRIVLLQMLPTVGFVENEIRLIGLLGQGAAQS